MPPTKHALLSASASHRWLNCTPSARLELEFEDQETEAAAEGTAAHALCEHKLRRALKLRARRKPISKYDSDEMDMHTDNYVQFVLEALAEARQHCADPVIHIEQRLDFSCYVPDGFGTGDCVIVGDKTLHIIDFKYGQGVLVEAERNPQMMLYALGALRIFDSLYDIEDVSMTIYQPRRENISTWTISVADLKAWAENELVPKAQLAYEGKGEYLPGPWCTFCKAAVKCRARAEEKLRLAQYEFAKPPLLTDDEIEDILGKLSDLTAWANEIISYAQGYSLMRTAAKTYGWNLNYGGIALMWRGGCIIRSVFLGKIKEAYDKNPELSNLLLDPYFKETMEKLIPAWRKVASSAVSYGVPAPAMTAALSYFDGYTTDRLPANLLQAQRDYFGAHTYERLDSPRGQFFHTNWTGHGGNTAASTYNA